MTTPGDDLRRQRQRNRQFDGSIAGRSAALYGVINTLYSYIYIKSDTWGTLNWGHLSPASDNPAVLADISGTVIESNSVFFEGGGFFLRPKGTAAPAALDRPTERLPALQLRRLRLGADCFGAAQPAVRYNSPTWGGFRFEASTGTADVVPAILRRRRGIDQY